MTYNPENNAMVAVSAAAPAKTPANAQKTYEVSRADLPVSCPLPDMMPVSYTHLDVYKRQPWGCRSNTKSHNVL